MSNQDTIEKLWDQRDQINFIQDHEAKGLVLETLDKLDTGEQEFVRRLITNGKFING